ncbi:MAG TPA: aminotransferase class I/II-fold pyridoxal phosphate-dependent enzyme, partial [Phycisphaerae bacterium]|nr:aminotransferase class I/II-fold pyridoxal phosphate-dependent enzyme [Phycisphaerae bacterium]
MDLPRSDRLNKLPPYLFADLRRKMKAARDKGVKVVRIDIGDPDQPAPDSVVEELCRTVVDPADLDRHRYGCDRPVEALPAAARDFYSRRYGVDLAEDQLVTTMGSKDAIVKFCLALMNPGDVAIAPVPGYPTYNIGHVFAGGETFEVPLLKANDY